MAKNEAMKKATTTRHPKESVTSQDDRNREKVVRESRDQYRTFLESINHSSDRDIDRAMSRM